MLLSKLVEPSEASVLDKAKISHFFYIRKFLIVSNLERRRLRKSQRERENSLRNDGGLAKSQRERKSESQYTKTFVERPGSNYLYEKEF